MAVLSLQEDDYICITDIARSKNADHTDDLIRNSAQKSEHDRISWYLEKLNNPSFNPVEFDGIKTQAGLNSFTLTPKQWIERTGAIGIVSSAGRYGGGG
ncbi:MAG: hypothetical protein U5R30_04725 [Deltaproteobacteria bacterium]|nr:hypothetical protein [Deltaproteobacteria bacterium]